MNEKEELEKIANHYGKAMQKLKTCEECAELIQALLKGDVVHIVEEIADVEIMIEQIKMLYAVRDLVDVMKEMKIARQIARMENEKE